MTGKNLTKRPHKEKMVSIIPTREPVLMELKRCCDPPSATEIANLRKEAQAFQAVRQALVSSSPEEAAQLVFEKVRGRRSSSRAKADLWYAPFRYLDKTSNVYCPCPTCGRIGNHPLHYHARTSYLALSTWPRFMLRRQLRRMARRPSLATGHQWPMDRHRQARVR